MKFKLLTILFLILCGCIVNAQYDSIKQINIELTEDFVGLIQLLHPEFFFSQDKEILNKNINKNFLEYKYTSDFIVPDSIKEDSTLLQNKDIFLELAEDYYWASVYQNNVKINDDEILEYYNQNKEKYVSTLTYDFWQVYIYDTTKIDNAIHALNKISKTNPDLIKEIKTTNNSYSINYEYDMTIQNSNPYYKTLAQTPTGKISKLIKLKNSYVLLLPVNKNGGETIPFKKIKEQCKVDLLNAKRQELEKQKEESIKNLYNISISKENQK